MAAEVTLVVEPNNEADVVVVPPNNGAVVVAVPEVPPNTEAAVVAAPVVPPNNVAVVAAVPVVVPSKVGVVFAVPVVPPNKAPGVVAEVVAVPNNGAVVDEDEPTVLPATDADEFAELPNGEFVAPVAEAPFVTVSDGVDRVCPNNPPPVPFPNKPCPNREVVAVDVDVGCPNTDLPALDSNVAVVAVTTPCTDSGVDVVLFSTLLVKVTVGSELAPDFPKSPEPVIDESSELDKRPFKLLTAVGDSVVLLLTDCPNNPPPMVAPVVISPFPKILFPDTTVEDTPRPNKLLAVVVPCLKILADGIVC